MNNEKKITEQLPGDKISEALAGDGFLPKTPETGPSRLQSPTIKIPQGEVRLEEPDLTQAEQEFLAPPPGEMGSLDGDAAAREALNQYKKDMDAARDMPGLEDYPRPPMISGTIDVGAFVKAEAEYRRRQTFFLKYADRRNTEQYLYELTQYSLAKDQLIEAMDEVLHQLGVL